MPVSDRLVFPGDGGTVGMVGFHKEQLTAEQVNLVTRIRYGQASR